MSESKLNPIPHQVNYYASENGEIWLWKNGQWLIVEQSIDDAGYKQVTLLTASYKRRCFRVHRLVASAWLGYRPSNVPCCHKDDVKTNNHVSNLYWGSHKSNAEDYKRNKNKQEYLNDRLRINSARDHKLKRKIARTLIRKFGHATYLDVQYEFERRKNRQDIRKRKREIQIILSTQLCTLELVEELEEINKKLKEMVITNRPAPPTIPPPPKEKATNREVMLAQKRMKKALEFLERMDDESENVG
jgi:hypothetical protein